MTPSPMRAEYQRLTSENPASRTARPAMTRAILTIWPAVPSSREIRLTMSPASSGVITPMTDEATVSSRKNVSSRRYGRAMPRIRLTVPFGSSREVTNGSRRKDRMAAMEVMGLLMVRPPLRQANARRDRALPRGSLSAASDEFADPAHLRAALRGVLGLVVVVHGRADQPGRRPAGAGGGTQQRGDHGGHRAVPGRQGGRHGGHDHCPRLGRPPPA